MESGAFHPTGKRTDGLAHNDPYGEHDFGLIQIMGQTFYFKMDYFDLNLSYRSEDPAAPTKTKRVLTLMLAEEY